MTGSGELFAKTDANIAKGIPVEKCTKEILRAIYHD
jgi:hypothetical protein